MSAKTGMTPSKKIIALTGGIGSGKSTVAQILQDEGFTVFSCDDVYSELLTSGALTPEIAGAFEGVLSSDGSLDRKALAEKVFKNSNALKTLDNITHPAIMKELLNRARKAEGEYVFCEVPLLFENGFEKLFDGVVVVMRNSGDRIKSVMQRSNLTKQQVEERINSQYDYSKIDKNKYFLVKNEGSIEDLRSTMRNIITCFYGV